MAYAGQTDNVEDLKYVAITTVNALADELRALGGITISSPGIVASDLPDGSEVTEYQYTFRRGEQILAAKSVLGTEKRNRVGDRRRWKYTLDLGYSHLAADGQAQSRPRQGIELEAIGLIVLAEPSVPAHMF